MKVQVPWPTATICSLCGLDDVVGTTPKWWSHKPYQHHDGHSGHLMHSCPHFIDFHIIIPPVWWKLIQFWYRCIDYNEAKSFWKSALFFVFLFYLASEIMYTAIQWCFSWTGIIYKASHWLSPCFFPSFPSIFFLNENPEWNQLLLLWQKGLHNLSNKQTWVGP